MTTTYDIDQRHEKGLLVISITQGNNSGQYLRAITRGNSGHAGVSGAELHLSTTPFKGAESFISYKWGAHLALDDCRSANIIGQNRSTTNFDYQIGIDRAEPGIL